MEIKIKERTEKTKIFTADCRYCGKHMERPYPEQLRFNMEIHEKTCKLNPDSSKRERKNEQKSEENTV